MATKIWVNIGSDNGLLPDGGKLLREPISTNHHCRLLLYTRRGISPERLTDSLLDMTYQITTSPLLKSNQIVLQCREVVLEYNIYIYIYAILRVVVSGASFWTAENFVIFRLRALSVVV